VNRAGEWRLPAECRLHLERPVVGAVVSRRVNRSATHDFPTSAPASLGRGFNVGGGNPNDPGYEAIRRRLLNAKGK